MTPRLPEISSQLEVEIMCPFEIAMHDDAPVEEASYTTFSPSNWVHQCLLSPMSLHVFVSLGHQIQQMAHH